MTPTFTIEFDLVNEVFVLVDTTAHPVPGDVRGIFQITGPAGEIYNNTDYSAADILPATSTTFDTVSIPKDVAGEFLSGTYSFTYSYDDDADDVADGTYTSSFSVNLVLPTIATTLSFDCRCAEFTSTDSTNYGDVSEYTLSNYVHTVKYPAGTGAADVVASTLTVVTPKLAQGTFTTVITADISIDKGTHTITGELSSSDGVHELAVDCTTLCGFLCAMGRMWDQYKDLCSTNPTEAKKLLDKVAKAEIAYSLYERSLDCGKDGSKYVTELTTLLGDCDCDDCPEQDGIWITPICGSTSSSGVAVVDAGNDITVTSVTVGDTTTYTVNVSASFIAQVAANSANISTNTTDIATNTGDISTNTAAIAAISESGVFTSDYSHVQPLVNGVYYTSRTATVPAGTLAAGDRLNFTCAFDRTSSNLQDGFRIRLRDSGTIVILSTTTDTQAVRGANFSLDVFVVDSTTIKLKWRYNKLGWSGAVLETVEQVYPSTYVVDDLTANPFYADVEIMGTVFTHNTDILFHVELMKKL